MWELIVLWLRAMFVLFLAMSFLGYGKSWLTEARQNLAEGTSPTTMYVGSVVQSTLMYGLPAWLLFNWRIALVCAGLMAVRLVVVTARAVGAFRQDEKQ